MTNADVENLLREADARGVSDLSEFWARQGLGASELLKREPSNKQAQDAVSIFLQWLREGKMDFPKTFPLFIFGGPFNTDEELAARAEFKRKQATNEEREQC